MSMRSLMPWPRGERRPSQSELGDPFEALHRSMNQVLDSFRRDFIGMLMRKQRYLTERILFLTASDVEERFFLFLEQQYGHRERYTIALSKRDFAAAIGTIPETFSRLLLRLREQGRIRWEGRTLTLPAGFWQGLPQTRPLARSQAGSSATAAMRASDGSAEVSAPGRSSSSRTRPPRAWKPSR